MLSIVWCALTKFGKERGVYIDQNVHRDRLIDSTYFVSTYIWDTNDFWGHTGTGSNIEWSSSKTVKCYDVEREKKTQRDAAIVILKRLKEFKKKGLDCNAE